MRQRILSSRSSPCHRRSVIAQNVLLHCSTSMIVRMGNVRLFCYVHQCIGQLFLLPPPPCGPTGQLLLFPIRPALADLLIPLLCPGCPPTGKIVPRLSGLAPFTLCASSRYLVRPNPVSGVSLAFGSCAVASCRSHPCCNPGSLILSALSLSPPTP